MTAESSTGTDTTFRERLRVLEEQMFSDRLDPTDAIRLRHDGYAWHYRPSHHAARGLINAEDVAMLSAPGHRLLSIGAFPAALEHCLVAVGLPPGHITITDIDPRILTCPIPCEKRQFDALEPWPADLGHFDRILFPESLCIMFTDRLQSVPDDPTVPHATDPLEAKLLAHVLGSALSHLAPGGIIRADGPMSHPNVVQRAADLLQAHWPQMHIAYTRYLLVMNNERKTQ